jgi:hypothetical protein
MKRIIPFLLLAFVALACEKDGPTVPIGDLQFGVDCDQRPDHPKCTDGDHPKVEYRFVFPETWEAAQALGGDCRWPPWEEDDPDPDPANPNGRTFRCPAPGDVTLAFQVVDLDGNPVDGTVTFKRCEDGDGVPQLWTRCGVRSTGKPKYHANEYAVENVVGGIVGVTLYESDRIVWHNYPIQGEVYGWGGMRWNYDAGDGKKPELGSDWYNIMPPYGFSE